MKCRRYVCDLGYFELYRLLKETVDGIIWFTWNELKGYYITSSIYELVLFAKGAEGILRRTVRKQGN